VTGMLGSNDLRCRLDACPPGDAGWTEFERVGILAMEYLFVPPLQPPRVQCRTLGGAERRDAVFANRQRDPASNWGLLHADHRARMILTEFKNYDKEEIGPEQVTQTSSYMRDEWGQLAIMCCSKKPTTLAHRHRNTIYGRDKKIILFVTAGHLREMLDIKDRGQDPSDFILDSVEEFLLQQD
jgi:hypothetical protein